MRACLLRGTHEHYADALLYDLEYAERTEDIRWYRKQVRQVLSRGQRVLELGSGSGRISCALARSGFCVTALDRMAPMLALLADKIEGKAIAQRIELVEADMREIPLPNASVPMVIAPFNAMMHLYSWQDLLACMTEVRRVLQPGGTFAFDVQMPDLDWLLWSRTERHGVTPITHPSTGERLIWSTNHRYDPCTQICDITIYYDPAPARGHRFVPPKRSRKRVKLTQRQIFPQELEALMAGSGMAVQSITADFSRAALHAKAASQCVVCRRDDTQRGG